MERVTWNLKGYKLTRCRESVAFAQETAAFAMTAQRCCNAETGALDQVGASICCEPESTRALPADGATVKDIVRRKYSDIALGEGCGGYSMIGDAYDDVEGYAPEADLGLGCGLPTQHAALAPGQTVLDLGSGAGMDAFVARREVGAEGTVIGLDFAEPMVDRARTHAAMLGYENVRFVVGDIEEMPLESASVDVVISNCVLNLVPAKRKAFAEIHRVLKPGGYFTISDVVLRGPLPEAVRQSVESYVGCVAGAMERFAYLRLIREAGFSGVRVMQERPIVQAAEALSITVRGVKPRELQGPQHTR